MVHACITFRAAKTLSEQTLMQRRAQTGSRVIMYMLMQEARAQLAQSAGQAVSLQIAVVDDSSRPVTALVTPAKPSAGLQHTGQQMHTVAACHSRMPDSRPPRQ